MLADGILKGMYRFQASGQQRGQLRAQLFGSGAILREVLRAQAMLEERYGVAADVWSVTSYKELYRDGHDVEQWNMLHPMEKPRVPVCHRLPGRRTGSAGGRLGLCQGAARFHLAVAASAAGLARHGRLRAQ